jgi:hypothetical protein
VVQDAITEKLHRCVLETTTAPENRPVCHFRLRLDNPLRPFSRWGHPSVRRYVLLVGCPGHFRSRSHNRSGAELTSRDRDSPLVNHWCAPDAPGKTDVTRRGRPEESPNPVPEMSIVSGCRGSLVLPDAGTLEYVPHSLCMPWPRISMNNHRLPGFRTPHS